MELSIPLTLNKRLSDSFSFLPWQIQSPVPWTPSLRPPCSSLRRSQAPPPLPCRPPPPPVNPRRFLLVPRCCPRCCSSRFPLPFPAPAPRGAQASTRSLPPPLRLPRASLTGCRAAPRPPLLASGRMSESGWRLSRALRRAAPRAGPQGAERRVLKTLEPPHRPAPHLLLLRVWKQMSVTSWRSCGR